MTYDQMREIWRATHPGGSDPTKHDIDFARSLIEQAQREQRETDTRILTDAVRTFGPTVKAVEAGKAGIEAQGDPNG